MNRISADHHPCFNKNASHSNTRVHLPVAPKCNIQCRYCNRKFDCVNESRPGVTSAVITPQQAVLYIRELSNYIKPLSVIGIAGPGDPMANVPEVFETLRLIRDEFPDKLFCIATNGVNIHPYIEQLLDLGLTHITLTINAVELKIAEKIYSWVRDGKRIYRGIAAAEFIVERQLSALPLLKEAGLRIKVNTIVIEGINDKHIGDIAQTLARYNVDVMNCVPLYPVEGTEFESFNAPTPAFIQELRATVSQYLPQMTHCTRCRADAAGLLGKDLTGAYGILQEYILRLVDTDHERPYVAVATHEGILVNMHLGEATSLFIYKKDENGYKFVEERTTPAPGGGMLRWKELASVLKDCKALLVAGIGENPLKTLESNGLRVIKMTGLIEEGLDAVYNNKPIRAVSKMDAFRCGSNCGGTMSGCA